MRVGFASVLVFELFAACMAVFAGVLKITRHWAGAPWYSCFAIVVISGVYFMATVLLLAHVAISVVRHVKSAKDSRAPGQTKNVESE